VTEEKDSITQKARAKKQDGKPSKKIRPNNPSNGLISKPRVYLIGMTTADHSEISRFLDDENIRSSEVLDKLFGDSSDIEGICKLAGQICYMSMGTSNRTTSEYFDHILESGHGSILEHATYNFIITGVSRSLTHELVRHRQGVAYSQLSQRYVDESDVTFIEPYTIELLDRSEREEYLEFLASARRYYQKLAKLFKDRLKDNTDLKGTDLRKAARGAARSVLPNATETKIMFSTNARALRHIIEMRCNPAADREIRDLFYQIWKAVEPIAPSIFGDYLPIVLEDGSKALANISKKV
jgi:thymidylate synthase (FAD)